MTDDTLPRTYFDNLITEYLSRFPADEPRLLSARRRFYQNEQLDILHGLIDRALQEEHRVDWQILMTDIDDPMSRYHLHIEADLSPSRPLPRLSI